MARRSYRQNCALARASDMIGERWTLLLVRDLLVAPRRFTELARSLKGIGTNLLAARLKELESAGIIERQRRDAGSHVYALTESGRALEPALLALVRWGLVYGPENQHGSYHQDDWDLLALKALFQPELAGNLTVRVQFKTDEFAAWMAIDDQQMTMGMGERPGAELIVNGTIKDLFMGSGSPDELLISGSTKKLQQFMSTFALPASPR